MADVTQNSQSGMKLLVGFDGSDGARAAVLDLRAAGLPPRGQAIVMNVADLLLGSPYVGCDPVIAAEASMPGYSEPTMQRVHELTLLAVKEANEVAAAGAALLRTVLPDWSITAEAVADSPYWGVIKRAAEWKANLAVVGSQGRSALGRLMLGSVSQNVLSHAPCSVRIGRQRHQNGGGTNPKPARILIATDGSDDARYAVDAVCSRTWGGGADALVVAAMDLKTSAVLGWFGGWVDTQSMLETGGAAARRQVDEAVELLRGAGITAAGALVEGDPKHAILKEAERWEAECIYLGARGHSRLERFLIGSVSAAVAARAHCSVEVIRKPRQ